MFTKMVTTLIATAAVLLYTGVTFAADWPSAERTKPRANAEFLNSGRFDGLPFSDAVRVGRTVYFSGQIGDTNGDGKLVPGGIRAQAKQTLENLKIAAQENHLKMADIVKCTVFLADMSEWSAFNEVYKTYFSKPFPARSAFGVTGLALGARVELECIAAT